MSSDQSGHGHWGTKASAAGVLIAMGIIYGDIGTSPLYVMKAIVGDKPISRELVLGGLSAVFWTLTLMTTIKYVLLTLQADNKGEGGIFSLYSLVRRRSKYLIIPAMIGGASMLADGVLTPTISVSAAIEGLRIFDPNIPTVPIVILILTGLFTVQQFGTGSIGRAFGPVMFTWFSTLMILGISQIHTNWDVLAAINPVYAFNLLTETDGGFWILGAVFLCTTGAEALYSDLGHCGLKNIRTSWVYVKFALLCNYFGQGAWLLSMESQPLNANPFYGIMPEWFVIPGIALATLATIIASQALISGSFTLVGEALRLEIWPKVRVLFPSNSKGQLYVPSVNWLLLAGCIAVILIFRESEHIEAAYGLTITIDMLMTTTLMLFFLKRQQVGMPLIILFGAVFFALEGMFFSANIVKLFEGAWFSLAISIFLIAIMTISYRARNIKNKLNDFSSLTAIIDKLNNLSADTTVPKFATHLVYMTGASSPKEVETKVAYSLFNKSPKRADTYWFVHVNVVDEPHAKRFRVHTLEPGKIFWIEFELGFRVEQRINQLFRLAVNDLVKNHEVDLKSRYPSLREHGIVGDFKFVVLHKYLSLENDLGFWDQLTMNLHFLLKRISLSEEKAFGLETSAVTIENVPMIIERSQDQTLERLPT